MLRCVDMDTDTGTASGTHFQTSGIRGWVRIPLEVCVLEQLHCVFTAALHCPSTPTSYVLLDQSSVQLCQTAEVTRLMRFRAN